jgi:glycyl-tRNA synthetase beta subunit
VLRSLIDLIESLSECSIDCCRERVPLLLNKMRLRHKGVAVEGTPRRLAVLVTCLEPSQSDASERIRGPPAKVPAPYTASITLSDVLQ